MKFTSIKILVLLSLWATVSCSPQQQSGGQAFYVSIAPLKEIVGGIVGNDFPIYVLVPSGASPETYEPTPKQFIALNRAELVFNVGLIDFETTLLQKIEDQKKIVHLCHGIDLTTGSCSHGHRHDPAGDPHHAHGIDPHTRNYERLKQRLKELDKRTAEKLAQCGTECFIIYHPALTYYARDYGLQQIAIESDGKEPSARRLGGVIRQARAKGIRKILYQSQFPASAVETVAHDIGAQPVQIDPLREDAINNIDEITGLITNE